MKEFIELPVDFSVEPKMLGARHMLYIRLTAGETLIMRVYLDLYYRALQVNNAILSHIATGAPRI